MRGAGTRLVYFNMPPPRYKRAGRRWMRWGIWSCVIGGLLLTFASPFLLFAYLFRARPISPAEFIGGLYTRVPLPHGLDDARAGVRGALTHAFLGLAGEFPAREVGPYLRTLERREWQVIRRTSAASGLDVDGVFDNGLNTLPRRLRRLDREQWVATAYSSRPTSTGCEVETVWVAVVRPPDSPSALLRIGVDVN